MEDELESRKEDAIHQGKKQNSQWYRSYFGKIVLVLMLGILVFGIVMIPVAILQTRKMNMTYSTSNSKAVYMILMDFESDYGHFPDDSSSASDPMLTDFHGPYSNYYLGQLIAGGYTQSEEIFYAHDNRYAIRKPDEVFSPPTCILEKNECGFSYVMVEEKGQRRGLSTKDHGAWPILAVPLVNKWGSFEKKTFNQLGAYLRIDGSIRCVPLNPSDQKIRLSGGKTLFESGPSTMWGNLTPVVLLPER